MLHAKSTRLKMKLCKAAMIGCWILSALVYVAFEGQIDSHPIVLVPVFTLFGLAIFFGFFERAQMPVRLRAPKAAREKFIGSSPLASAVLDCTSAEFAQVTMQANKEVQQADGGDAALDAPS